MSRPVVIMAVLWVALVLLSLGIEQATGRAVPTCMFKRLTGYPCATCGSTRATIRLFHGDIWGAVVLNPLFVVLLIGGVAYGAWTLARPEPRRLAVGARTRHIVWSIGLLLLVANWAYVINRGN